MEFLIVIEPASGGRYEHRVAPGSYVLGREEASCDIPILSPEVSRQHARIHLSAEQCSVEDLGSTAGTAKDGQALDGKQTFPFPAEVMLGTTKLTVSVSEAVEMTYDSDSVGTPTANPSSVISFNQGQPQASKPSAEVGHYTKGREIARGGMGAILEANDKMLGRMVAMKVVLEDRASEDARMRFIREATVLGQLEHPNIIPIHELGKDDDGNLFYTMKMVEGRTLQAIINDLEKCDASTIEHYQLDRLLTVFSKVCDAMAFAHSKGIVHRDLKPENVMVGAFGEVLVMDWGLAKILKDEAQTADELGQQQQLSTSANAPVSQSALPTGFQELTDSQMRGSSEELTMDGAVMGSPQYMPPEQAEGRVADIDEKSDIYSLGGILYAILTLRPPIKGKTVIQVLENVKSGNITPPTEFNPGGSEAKPGTTDAVKDPGTATALPHCPGGRVPAALSAVTLKAMAQKSSARYRSVPKLIAEIDAFQHGHATTAEDISLLGELLLLIKRNKAVALTGFVAVILLFGIGGYSFNKVVQERNLAQTERDRANDKQSEANDAAADAKRALALSKISLAEATLVYSDARQGRSYLSDVPEEQRNEDWHYLSQKLEPATSLISGRNGARVSRACPHPTRPSIFVIWDSEGSLGLVNVKTGESVLDYPGNYRASGPHALAMTRDGSRLAVAHNQRLTFLDADTGEPLGEFEGVKANRLEWSQNGRLLAYSAGWSTAGLFDVTTGKVRWQLEPLASWGYRNRNLHFLPKPGRILEIHHAHVAIRDINDSKVIRKLGNPGLVLDSRISPDGKTLINSQWASPIIEKWNLNNGNRETYHTGFRQISSIAFADQGQLVLACGAPRDQESYVWYGRADTQEKLGAVYLKNRGNLITHPLSGEALCIAPRTEAIEFRTRPVSVSLGDHGGTLSRLAFLGTNDSFIGPSAAERRRFFQRIDPSKNTLVRIGDEAASHLHYKYRDFHASRDGDRFLAFSSSPKYRYLALYERKEDGNSYGVRSEGQIDTVANGIPALSATADALRFWCRDGIFDSVTRRRLATLELPPKGMVTQAAWDHDGTALTGLVTRKHDNQLDNEYHVIKWTPQTGRILRQRRMNAPMNVVKLSQDGKRLAVGGADKSVHFFDADTLEVQSRLRAHDKAVINLAWHPNRPFLVTASHDLNLKLWDLTNLRLVETLRRQKEPAINLEFSPSGRFLFCLSEEGNQSFFWNMRDLLTPPETAASPAPALSPGAANAELPELHASLKKKPPLRDSSRIGKWILPRDSGLPLREFNGFKEISRDADYRIQDINSFRQHNRDAERLLGGPVPDSTDFLFHSREQMRNPHIVIRLKTASQIRALKVLNRSHPDLHARAKNLTLWLSNNEKSWRQFWQAKSAQPEWLIDLPNNPRARYLKLGLPGKGTLHLKEVVVFGKRR